MIAKELIESMVKEAIKGTSLFIVAVKVSSSNRITVMADKKEGITIDECALIHKYIESKLDRDKEDFDLLVSSPGLDMPFTVIEQYEKNEGKRVSIVDYEGTKYSGILKNVTSGGFEVGTEIKIKGKTKEVKELSFNFDQIKTCRVILTIK